MPYPGHPSTPPGNRKGDAKTRPPPPPNQQQAEQGTRAGNAEGREPPETAIRASCEGTKRQPKDNKRGRDATSLRERPQKHTTDTRRAPKGQRDRVCERHRPNGMEYQQARTRDSRKGKPATSIARGAREGQQGGGGQREAAPSPPPKLPRAPRTHRQNTAPSKAVVAHSTTHQVRG